MSTGVLVTRSGLDGPSPLTFLGGHEAEWKLLLSRVQTRGNCLGLGLGLGPKQIDNRRGSL
jgi:hypothetical protein